MADFASKLRENPETAVNRSLLAYGFGYDIRIRSIERALFDYGRRRTPHHILRIVLRHRAWRNRGLGRTVRRRQELAADRFRTAQSARVRRFTVGWPFRRRFHPAAVARAGRVPAAEAGAVGRDGGAGDSSAVHACHTPVGENEAGTTQDLPHRCVAGRQNP